MDMIFNSLTDADLKALLTGLRQGRVAPPFPDFQITSLVSSNIALEIGTSLRQLTELGFTTKQIETTFELLLQDRHNRKEADNTKSIDLVTSGPAPLGTNNRDTAVVVRELFTHAEKSVMVVGYAVYQGNSVFEALARRMEELPDLKVKFFLNIARRDRDTNTPNEVIVSQFAQQFRDRNWPKNCRLPDVYFDPRSVSKTKNSSLHAKCVVVDSKRVFVSSANFTNAGQDRNIEVGLNLDSPNLAKKLIHHFETLQERGYLERAFGDT
jgi:phosphatidylserine/phosphatidylglycerophosphate/cardiolipin synthase-like enzyme